MFNPFLKDDPQRRLWLEQEKAVKDNLAELRRVANELLIDTRYHKFTELLKKGEENILSLFLDFKEADPLKYKAKMDEYLIELQVYRKILRAAADLAKPHPRENVDYVQKFKSRVGELLDNIQ